MTAQPDEAGPNKGSGLKVFYSTLHEWEQPTVENRCTTLSSITSLGRDLTPLTEQCRNSAPPSASRLPLTWYWTSPTWRSEGQMRQVSSWFWESFKGASFKGLKWWSPAHLHRVASIFVVHDHHIDLYNTTEELLKVGRGGGSHRPLTQPTYVGLFLVSPCHFHDDEWRSLTNCQTRSTQHLII